MKLALFDLDHTLIPFDSGMAWTQFLVARGVLPAEAEARYLAYCHEYVAGTLDIHAMHRASFAPLRSVALSEVALWQAGFAQQMAARVPEAAHALVARHRDAGHLCALVTATDGVVAAPFAQLLGIDHVVATEAEIVAGHFTGEIDGEPCYRHGKLNRVAAWLASHGTTLANALPSWFYSDSASDLPLLEAVSHPVAVNPDLRLRAHAAEAGWPVLQLPG